MEKIIFFDTGPIISLVMSRLVWIIPKLKEKFGGKFYITPAVRRELIERPMKVKRFQFEALQVLKLIKEGVLEVYKDIPYKQAKELENLADASFKFKNKTLDIIQSGEMEAVSSALKTGAEAVVMDERTLRLFIENSSEMKKLLEFRFKREVIPDLKKIKQFSQQLQGVKIIRSIELVGVAYKLGILDDYIPKLKDGKKILLDAVLWGTKFNGCAVTGHEIEEIKNHLL
jgi:hypothetical protein